MRGYIERYGLELKLTYDEQRQSFMEVPLSQDGQDSGTPGLATQPADASMEPPSVELDPAIAIRPRHHRTNRPPKTARRRAKAA